MFGEGGQIPFSRVLSQCPQHRYAHSSLHVEAQRFVLSRSTKATHDRPHHILQTIPGAIRRMSFVSLLRLLRECFCDGRHEFSPRCGHDVLRVIPLPLPYDGSGESDGEGLILHLFPTCCHCSRSGKG